MATAFANWFADNRDVYIGNATAVRDYRVQLRGNRSVLLFGIYLMILIGVAVFTYSSSTGMFNMSIVDAQQHLHNFYQVTMGLLGLTVCVVAPGLTATSIVLERQRQSIDLVFSAPVTPKYYLVGKMISSFRYTWMLLVLALPITAASVVLGGASWSEVLVSYILLSFQGLMLTAFALLMSTIAPKPVSAIIYSYGAALIYGIFGSVVSTAAMYSMRFGHGAGSESPFWVALSPFTAVEAARTYTTIAGHQIPNWIFMAGVSLLVAKICLLGAGTILSPSSGKEVFGLRIHGLLYLTALSLLGGWSLWPYLSHSSMAGSPGDPLTPSGMAGLIVTWCTAPFLVILPFISCFGIDRESRFRPNGFFSLRRILDGTPGGGLPFLWASLIAVYGGFDLGGQLSGDKWISSEYFVYAFFGASFWTLFWAIGRFASSYFIPLKSSRTLVFAAFVFIAALPYPFLVAVSGIESDSKGRGLWPLYVLSPIASQSLDSSGQAMIVGLVMAILSAVLIGVSEGRVKAKLATVRNYDERPYQAA